MVGSLSRSLRRSTAIDPYFEGLFSENVSAVGSNSVFDEHISPGVTGATASGSHPLPVAQ